MTKTHIPGRFEDGPIAGITWRLLTRHTDARGWLLELFRDDDLPEEYRPAMAYASMTEGGVTRGPHEHRDQADYFCFFGPADFCLSLWDIRVDSPSYGNHDVVLVGETKPMAVIVPPGVVHAYRNIGTGPGLVFNAPNRLYKGPGRLVAADEIRHEADQRFTL